MERVLFFDTETTGLPPKGKKWEKDFNEFPHVVSFTWWFDDEFKDRIIKPEGYIIPEEATAVHGITQAQAEANGIPYQSVVDEFLRDALVAEKVIAHNIYFDSSIVKANALRLRMEFFSSLLNEALDKEKRVDTMMKTIKFVGAKFPDGRKGVKWPTLMELYKKLFGEDASFDAHNSLEDVKALMQCYYKLVELKILS